MMATSQVGKASGEADVGDVCAPDLIGALDRHATQQVRVHLVLRVCPAGVGARRHPLQVQRAHQALGSFAVDGVA